MGSPSTRLAALLLPLAASAVQLPSRPPPTIRCTCHLCSPLLIGDERRDTADAAIGALKFYKKVISPLIPPGCRFIPTCSEYGQQCFEQFSVPQSIVLIAWRLIRCNPLHLPKTGYGNDPPVWPPPAYWTGDGTLRTFIDDERSRARAAGELDETPIAGYDPLGISDESSSSSDEDGST